MTAVTAQAWNPAHYDRAGAFVPRLGADLLELLAPRPGERILDLGSGTGELSAKIAEQRASVLGLDASSQMVAEASRKHPHLQFQQGDGQELRFEAEFDAVFSNATLHWMPRADDVARGVARALKPSGRFVAEFGGARNVQTVRDALEAALTELGLADHATPDWYFPSLPAHVACLANAGLWVRSAQWFERPTLLEGPAGLSHWLELFCLPLLTALGPRRAEVVADVEARCHARLFRDGGWWLDYTRLRVVATRP